jgi:hypothetical protein
LIVQTNKKCNLSHSSPPLGKTKTPDLYALIAQVGCLRGQLKQKESARESCLCNRLLSTGPALWLLPFQQSLLSQSNPYELPSYESPANCYRVFSRLGLSPLRKIA